MVWGMGYGVWGPLLVFGATNKLSCPLLTTKPCGYPKLGMTAKEGLHTQRKTERNMYNKKEDENCVGEEVEFTTMQLMLPSIVWPLRISPVYPLNDSKEQNPS